MSLNATASSLRLTILAGISPRTTLQNRQSAMDPPQSGLTRGSGSDDRRSFKAKCMSSEIHGLEAGIDDVALLRLGEASFGPNNDSKRLRIEGGRQNRS